MRAMLAERPVSFGSFFNHRLIVVDKEGAIYSVSESGEEKKIQLAAETRLRGECGK